MREKIKDRYNLIAAAFILIGIVILIQLANLQVIHGKKFDEDSQRRLLNERKITASRGGIFDTNGVPIAVNRMGYTIQIVNSDLSDNELNEMLLKLVGIFEKNNDTYNKGFSRYITFNPVAFGSAVKNSKDPVGRITAELGLKEKDTKQLKTAKEVFDYLREKRFRIDKKYTDEQAYKIMTLRYEIIGFSMLNPVILARDVSKETMAEIEERNREFPGVSTDVEPFRKYIDAAAAAHVVGYIRAIDSGEYEELKDKGYSMTDFIGKTGIEKAAEKWLKGKDGERRVEVDIEGRLTAELDRNPATPGNNVILTLDMKLQKIAMESLKRNIERIKNKEGETANAKLNFGDAKAGSVVAIDVNTGEVIVMASYPSYDPAVFLAGPEDRQAQKTITELFADSNSPSVNRAIQGIYAPGSTFKPLVGIAALEEGAVTPTTYINDIGYILIDGMKFTCMEYRHGLGAHGKINLSRALATSCNIYFHEVGMMTGIDKIDKWAKYFGLGEKTGIEIGPGVEASGIRANREFKKTIPGASVWGAADTAQASIGQLYNSFTPLQLANYISTLANGGKRYTPHLIKRVVSPDGKTVYETPISFEEVPVKKETIDAVKAGMIAVTNSEDGTATRIFDGLPFKVAAKTGTAETGNEKKSNNGVFVAYAPADNPKIAIAIVIEQGVYGKFAAPIARDIIAEYFNLNDKNSIGDAIKPDEVAFTR